MINRLSTDKKRDCLNCMNVRVRIEKKHFVKGKCLNGGRQKRIGDKKVRRKVVDSERLKIANEK